VIKSERLFEVARLSEQGKKEKKIIFDFSDMSDRQVNVTGISTVSFDVSVSQVLWPLQ
jgi:hypothetical protein